MAAGPNEGASVARWRPKRSRNGVSVAAPCRFVLPGFGDSNSETPILLGGNCTSSVTAPPAALPGSSLWRDQRFAGRLAMFFGGFRFVPRDDCFHQPLLPGEFGRRRFERGPLGWGVPHDCHAVFQGKTSASAAVRSWRTSRTERDCETVAR